MPLLQPHVSLLFIVKFLVWGRVIVVLVILPVYADTVDRLFADPVIVVFIISLEFSLYLSNSLPFLKVLVLVIVVISSVHYVTVVYVYIV